MKSMSLEDPLNAMFVASCFSQEDQLQAFKAYERYHDPYRLISQLGLVDPIDLKGRTRESLVEEAAARNFFLKFITTQSGEIIFFLDPTIAAEREHLIYEAIEEVKNRCPSITVAIGHYAAYRIAKGASQKTIENQMCRLKEYFSLVGATLLDQLAPRTQKDFVSAARTKMFRGTTTETIRRDLDECRNFMQWAQRKFDVKFDSCSYRWYSRSMAKAACRTKPEKLIFN